MIGSILTLIILILLSAVFSGTEIAMFSLSDLKIRHLVDKGTRGAKLLSSLKKDSHKLLITILIGNNIVNIASASFATVLAIQLFGNVGVGIATGVMTFLILIFGEIIPKAFATKNAQQIALIMAPVINVLKYLFYPFVLFFNLITRCVVSEDSSMEQLTEDEVKDMLKISGEQGEIKHQEEEMIRNIFKLDDTVAEQVMTPRPEVFALEAHQTVGEVKSLVLDKGFSRIPVYENDLDKIKGLLYVKDILGIGNHVKIGTILRPVFFVLETKRVDLLLYDFKQKQSHLAIVVNEHGTVLGIITIEDLLEEIVGEIYDETDNPEDGKLITQIDEVTYLISGKTELSDVESLLKISLQTRSENNTLSGFLIDALSRMPKENDEVWVDGFLFKIISIDDTKILEVEVTKKKK